MDCHPTRFPEKGPAVDTRRIPTLPDDLTSTPQSPDVCWRAQWGTYAGGVHDSEFLVDRDFCEAAHAFFDVDPSAMAEKAGQPCWASLERFRTCRADGRPCVGLDWVEERHAELVAFRMSPMGTVLRKSATTCAFRKVPQAHSACKSIRSSASTSSRNS